MCQVKVTALTWSSSPEIWNRDSTQDQPAAMARSQEVPTDLFGDPIDSHPLVQPILLPPPHLRPILHLDLRTFVPSNPPQAFRSQPRRFNEVDGENERWRSMTADHEQYLDRFFIEDEEYKSGFRICYHLRRQ
ncbi:hypothetical protein LOK49_LG10G00402 [Camellia lanceoleosa]|uniref:Uncharacterized protein n=1 Tax=Camellia lanceoleosa TaxID=1840588 RepID=A0ACC0G819_9ERIC|nr:hypothetical protein LOK49_LG10G00402 [Camellia lanceoleosa]